MNICPNSFLIKNAFIFDGLGNSPVNGDLLVENGEIREVGLSLSRSTANTIYDAKGLALCPGFIDAHSHSDISILAAPVATGKISQGVTTDIIGNCGLSVYPISSKNRDHLNDLYKHYNVPITWNEFDGYADELQRRCPAINIAALVGHNTLRSCEAGYQEKSLTSSELSGMREKLSKSLRMGAAGFSTGFLYVPGKFSDDHEILSLLKVLSETAKPYTTHLRSESVKLLESIEETLSLGKRANLSKVHISHLKVGGEKNWYKIDDVIRLIEDARNMGNHVTADRYPYIESMTQLSVIIPEPYKSMTDADLVLFLSSDTNYEAFLSCLAKLPESEWRTCRLVSTKIDRFADSLSKTFAQMSLDHQVPPWRLCGEVLRWDSTSAMAAFAGMNEENMEKIVSRRWVCCGSDESARPDDYSIGRSHPRGFGSFPRFMKVAGKNESLQATIARITSLPASIFSLNDRGRIAPGYAADLILFDPDQFSDSATFAAPHSLARGLRKVWVNGLPAYKDGQTTQFRGGRVLRIKA